ncbi:MAG: aldo/keto reductase [Pirellulaceae bacterium]|nr:aldo/keto reductase [Planctomycetales bacterium]
MQRRRLGNHGPELTTIGLGTWAIGGGNWRFGWGDQDADEAINAVLRAVDLGINWIDTAAVYGDGESEKLVGQALARIPANQRPLIATKCTRIVQADGSITPVMDRRSIFTEFERSLRHLQVETIDLYQLHWPQPEEDIEEGWGALAELVQQGKVRHIGVCNFNVAQMKRIQPIHPIASLQPPYSMLVRDIEQEILPFCESEGIGVVGYSPMYKGLLTGSFDSQRADQLPENDHRSRDPRFQPPQLGIHLSLVGKLKEVAAALDCTVAQLAIAWTLRMPAVTSAIVGARRPQQIESTVAASDLSLDADTLRQLDALLAEHARALQEVA